MKKGSSNDRLILNSVIYSMSGLLLKCFSFFLLPLYTAYLTTEEYGVTSIASSFLTTMSYIVAFSLFSAVMRFYVDLKNNPEKLKRFYGTVTSFTFLSGIVFAVILYFCRALLARYVFAGVDFYPVILICLISLIFQCQHTIYDNILKSQQRAAKASILSIAYFLVNVGLNILFVVVLKFGAAGVVLSTAISGLLYTLFFVFDMVRTRSIVFCMDFEMLKESLKYSIPIMPHNLSTQIAMLFSKSMIGGVATLASLGIYSVASQFGNISDTIHNYVNQAYGPWLYEQLNDKEEGYKTHLRGTVKMLSSVIGLFLLGIAIFAQDYILLLVDKAYADAWKYVPFIVLVYVVKTAYYFYVNILFYYKKAAKVLFVATLTGSLVNIGLSAFMIPLYGVYGSILADAISMIIRVAIVIIISKQFEDIGIKVKDFIANFLIVTIFICAGLALSVFKYQYAFSIWNFMYKILIVALYVGLIMLMNREHIKPMFNRFVKRK